MGLEVERGHLGVGDVLTFRISPAIELASHTQPGRGAGRADQVDDHRQTHQRLAAPVGADVREESMLDLVPLAGPGRKVTDGDRDARTVGQALQFPLPQPYARAIAPAGVRRDEQGARASIAGPPHLAPPPPDRPRREGRRIVIDAHTDPARVAGEIVDPIGDGLAALRNEKFMHPDGRGLAGRPPLTARVLEVTDQFLLLRVDGDDGLRGRLEPPDLLVDIPELRVAVGMGRPFARLAIGLETVARRRQQFGHQLSADLMAHALEALRQVPNALGGPAQGRHRVARSGRLHQPLEIGQEGRIFLQRLLASASWTSDAARGKLPLRVQLLEAALNRGIRDPRRTRDAGDATAPRRPGFRSRPDPPRALRQCRRQRLVLRPAEPDIHASSVPGLFLNSCSYYLTVP